MIRLKPFANYIKFVRFGKAPSNGRSYNSRDSFYEEGVSVYQLNKKGPDYKGWYFGFIERPAYIGVGKVVSRGSDGEPVVKISEIKRASSYYKKKYGFK